MAYKEEDLRAAVDAVFAKYDTDKSGSLEAKEVQGLINDALNHIKAGRQVSEAEVVEFIKQVDQSGDGKVQKPELLIIFKKALA
jgi:Ca2+-binding EF-hand superfamily protein